MRSDQPISVGRYVLHRKIARGGMASIHIARQIGDVGFSRIVAAKRMHPEFALDRDFVAMFLDEASIASKVRHRNVVQVIDVVTFGSELLLVQEYVHGAPLSLLLRNAYETKAHVPVPVAASIACQTLAGLHAVHETVDEMGTALRIVHRDVSPQNIIVGTDGTARLLDFGIAKAALTRHITRQGTFKGKLGYSSPEQIRGEATQHSDIYSAGVVLWELLAGRRMHEMQTEAEMVAAILAGDVPSVTDTLSGDRTWIGSYRWSQLEGLEPIVRKALSIDPKKRWRTAADMQEAIANAVPIAPEEDVAAWLRAIGGEFLDKREKLIAEHEASWRKTQSVDTSVDPPPSFSTVHRGPTALIAVLVILLATSVALLLRGHPTTAPSAAALPQSTPELLDTVSRFSAVCKPAR